MVEFQHTDFYTVKDLERIVTLLRGPGGCPWDAEQTHESIRRNLLEEAYEAAEAIDQGDAAHLKEELGDVLLQVAFHADLERERNGLTLDQIADGVCKKLIYRHPHVFGDVTVSGTGEVLSNWEELKRREKGQETCADTMDAVARSLPALWRAEKVLKKAEKGGLAPTAAEVSDKLSREAQALCQGNGDLSQAVGGLLFAAVDLARRAGVDPEEALGQAVDAFIAQARAEEPHTKDRLNSAKAL